MNITKNNFKEFLPLIKDAIDEAHFVAIDTELTGLGTDGLYNAFDTMSERYSKIQQNCTKYLIIQYGLSCFQYHPKQNKYTHKDFNFYIFPKPHIQQAPDPIFTCQTSSIHFLISNGFDFNKTFHEGIPYLNPSNEEILKEQLKNKHQYEKETLASESNGTSKVNSNQQPIVISDEQKDFVERISNQVDVFMSNDAETVLNLEPCNSFHRKLIYQVVQKNHPKGIDMFSKMNDKMETSIVIMKVNEGDKMDRLQTKQMLDMNVLDAAVGFRKVLDHLSQSRKLIIAHHMLLDIFHTINQFFSPAPESLKEFKELVHALFPRLLDTKDMASSEKFRNLVNSTHLPELLKTVKGIGFKLPLVEPADGYKGYELGGEDKLHEAGYDAFIAGLCYLGLKTKLGSMQSPVQYIPPDSEILSPYVNRFYIMKHYDIQSLNLSAPDLEPCRKNVFHVSFPRECRTVDLIELFFPFGRVYIDWINDTSALVALKDPEQILNVKSTLLKCANSMYKVKTYAEFKNPGGSVSLPTEKRPAQSGHADSPVPNKRRSVGIMETSARSIAPIPEADENEAEIDGSDTPSAKKCKVSHEEPDSSEVSSTAKLFEEENDW